MIDNGEPSLNAEQGKLRWAKIYITEILEGIEALSFEQRGYYLTALFKMYARMGGIPADKREGARIMRCDIRTFERLRDQLLSAGKLYVEGGLLKNSRVEREINEYLREFKKRHEAALEREQKARDRRSSEHQLYERSGGLPADFPKTSVRSRREVGENSLGLGAEKSTKSNDAPPQLRQNSTTNQNQEPEPDKKTEYIRAVSTAPIDEAFEQFWLAFPDERRRGKGKCRDLFQQIVSGKHAKRKASTDEILAAIRAGNGIDPNFPPMPETWLNQGRWEDLPKGAKPTNAEPEPEPVSDKKWGWWRPQKESILRLPVGLWRSVLKTHPPNGTWPWWVLGAPPGHPECLMPAELIQEHGFAEIYRGRIHHG